MRKIAPMNWPPLPTTGYIAGRSATRADVEDGNAVFYQQTDDGGKSQPFDVTIPQYALCLTPDDLDVPAILVQAERHITDPNAEAILGLRDLDGGEIVALNSEVALLGTDLSARRL